jgi:hypothetical protein
VLALAPPVALGARAIVGPVAAGCDTTAALLPALIMLGVISALAGARLTAGGIALTTAPASPAFELE